MNFFKKKDGFIAVSILIISCLAILLNRASHDGDDRKAEIFYESDLILTIDLTEKVDKLIKFPLNEEVIFHQYEDGSIQFETSNCTDKVCVNSGRLSYVGSSAACLPNKIILKILPVDSSKESDIDLIIQ